MKESGELGSDSTNLCIIQLLSKDSGPCFVRLVSIHFSLYRLGKWISAAQKSIRLPKSVLDFNMGKSRIVTSLYCGRHNKKQLCNTVSGMITKKEPRYHLLRIIVQGNATLTMIALTWKRNTMESLFGLNHFREPSAFISTVYNYFKALYKQHYCN